MTHAIATLLLLITLSGCRVVSDNASDRTLMYIPRIDGGPVHVERGTF